MTQTKRLVKRPLFIFSQLLFTLLFLMGSAYSFECSPKSLLQEKMMTDDCLLELIRGGYENGNVFDIENYMLSLSVREAEENLDEEARFSRWIEERLKGSLSQWDYIGSTGCYHIIKTHIEGDTWRVSDLSVLKFLDNGITLVSQIGGLKNSEIVAARLEENHIFYDQLTTGSNLYEAVIKIYPHLKSLIPEICGELNEVKRDIIGYITYRIALDGHGKFTTEEMISFQPCEGWAPYSGKEYQVGELESLILKFCLTP